MLYQVLIKHGANGDVTNMSNITALTVVNHCYSTLGDIMMDKLVRTALLSYN